jgi:hypothetical protein
VDWEAALKTVRPFERARSIRPPSIKVLTSSLCSRSSADRTRSCEGRGRRSESCREHFFNVEGEAARERWRSSRLPSPPALGRRHGKKKLGR